MQNLIGLKNNTFKNNTYSVQCVIMNYQNAVHFSCENLDKNAFNYNSKNDEFNSHLFSLCFMFTIITSDHLGRSTLGHTYITVFRKNLEVSFGQLMLNCTKPVAPSGQSLIKLAFLMKFCSTERLVPRNVYFLLRSDFKRGQ